MKLLPKSAVARELGEVSALSRADHVDGRRGAELRCRLWRQRVHNLHVAARIRLASAC